MFGLLLPLIAGHLHVIYPFLLLPILNNAIPAFDVWLHCLGLDFLRCR